MKIFFYKATEMAGDNVAFFGLEHIKWLYDNNIFEYIINSTYNTEYNTEPVIGFFNKEDAMAFKLRWL